ncbi:MAG: ATP-dependent 6-phosphofructokinase [bacterium]
MTAQQQARALAIQALDFSIPTVGEPTLPSPVAAGYQIPDDRRISYFHDLETLKLLGGRGALPAFEAAGPRGRLFHDPAWTRAGIVTCGGLCPGINHVIKALVETLYFVYGVENVFGIRYGYRGLAPQFKLEPLRLDPEVVDTIHESGGSILGSSRGPQEPAEMLRTLDRLNLNILFTIGGDGTQRGALTLANAARERRLPISIIGVPKTVDNDLDFTDITFGFQTAVHAATPIIACAHDEAKGAYNGISIVRLMGRDSGFIAAFATLANPVVNLCLVPESPFSLEGPGGLLNWLERRLETKHHVVIVVAEGAGQNLFAAQPTVKDASGNVLHQDIGTFLRDRIHEHLATKKVEHAIRYFDPSYQIRAVPAEGTDAVFCGHLAENAVHAAMAGKTGMVVGHWNGQFTHVPIQLAVQERRKINLDGQLWRNLLNVTRQEAYLAAT